MKTAYMRWEYIPAGLIGILAVIGASSIIYVSINVFKYLTDWGM